MADGLPIWLHELSSVCVEDIAAIAADVIVVDDVSKLARQSQDRGKSGELVSGFGKGSARWYVDMLGDDALWFHIAR